MLIDDTVDGHAPSTFVRGYTWISTGTKTTAAVSVVAPLGLKIPGEYRFY